MNKRLFYLLLNVGLFLLCYVIVKYFESIPFVRGFLGDVIVIGLMYTFIKIFFVVLNPLKLSVSLLLFAYVIELMQYFKLVDMLGLGEYRLARLVIGTSFDLWDLVAYACGFVLTLFVALKYQNPNSSVSSN